MASEVFFTEKFFQIDNKGFARFGHDGYYFSETGRPKNPLNLEKMSFKEFWDYNKLHTIEGIHLENTWYRKKPIIYIHEYFGEDLCLKENSFKSISICSTSKKKSISLNWLFEHLNSSQAIKYLQDRGMNVCPLEKEKKHD